MQSEAWLQINQSTLVFRWRHDSPQFALAGGPSDVAYGVWRYTHAPSPRPDAHLVASRRRRTVYPARAVPRHLPYGLGVNQHLPYPRLRSSRTSPCAAVRPLALEPGAARGVAPAQIFELRVASSCCSMCEEGDVVRSSRNLGSQGRVGRRRSAARRLPETSPG